MPPSKPQSLLVAKATLAPKPPSVTPALPKMRLDAERSFTSRSQLLQQLNATYPRHWYETRPDYLTEWERRHGIISDGAKSAGIKSDDIKSTGIKSDGDKSDGIKSDGDKSDGIKSAGDKSDGIKSTGDKSDGAKSDGDKSDGHKSDGVKSDGIKSDGKNKTLTRRILDWSDALPPKRRVFGDYGFTG